MVPLAEARINFVTYPSISVSRALLIAEFSMESEM